MKLLNPNALIVRKNKIKPLKVLAKARPAASNGFINNNEKTILQAKLCIDIFAVSNCCSFAYNQRENIFAKPKGSKPIKYIVKISAVFTVSCLENAPLSKRILIIKLSKTIPIIVAILRSTNKIRDDFFIKLRAFSSFLFFIDFAIIGNKAIEVAMQK